MNFTDMGLAPRLVEALTAQGITEPTPIQTRAIPLAMEGRDVMGLAQTGTGKTAAFGLPIVHRLLSMEGKRAGKSARALILAPTRELAKQIADNLSAYTEGTGIKVAIVVGGAGITGQTRRLEKGTDLLVATPGRLIDLLDRGAVRLNETRYLVLDEADQMLDLGFIHALRRIAPLLPAERQTMLFSATMPAQMAELSRAYLTNPERVEVAPPGKVADKIEQSIHFVAKADKTDLLIRLMGEHTQERAIVFGRTKHGSEKLFKVLEKAGFAAASIHGNKSQGQRDRALRAFKEGEVKVLVATDVAARGLDIPEVKHVYNYDLPDVPENYVHRIGRTARAGADGMAVAFCAPDEAGNLRDIQRTMKLDIPVASGTPWAPHEEEKPKRGGGGGGGRRGGSGGNQRRGGGGGGRTAGPKSAGPGGKPASKPGNRRRRKSRSAAS